MSFGSLMNSCPDWSGVIPDARRAEYSVQERRAIDRAIQTATTQLLDLDSLRDWHELLFFLFVPIDYYAGNFRQHDQTRPCLMMNNAVGGVHGVEFQFVQPRMRQLINAIRLEIATAELNWTQHTPIERAELVSVVLASAIGEFIRIHPFVNGNGRISRLLWRWGFHRFGVRPQVRISPRPGDPYNNVMQLSMRGDDGPLAVLIASHLAQYPPSLVA